MNDGVNIWTILGVLGSFVLGALSVLGSAVVYLLRTGEHKGMRAEARASQAKHLADLELRMRTMEAATAQIREQLSEQNTDLKWIRRALARMQDDPV